ncbi:MAG: hypothetical protein QOG72_329 [Sphingomonadales bacterium]|jgi:hypothetical protein|nr:hypothetical protein [Sphingomonadales bacterium]
MNFPICPCDDHVPRVPVNPPQQETLQFRFGDYAQFRRAVLKPVDGEVSIAAWRTQGEGDLAVMMAEWFAYIADILTFYDERIANQSYLRTADLDASVRRLIQILGHRPRPAIGATGLVAALVTRGQSAVLPSGLQFQSKPGPGQPPQIFELLEDTPIAAPDLVSAKAPPVLLSPIARFRFANLSVGLEFAAPQRALPIATAMRTYSLMSGPTTGANYGVLLLGAVTSVDPGDQLLLRVRDSSKGGPYLATVTQAVVQPAPGGGKQTALALQVADNSAHPLTTALASTLDAAGAALDKPVQSISVWNLYGGQVSGATVHLSSLARQIRPQDWILFTAPGWSFLAQVKTTADVILDAKAAPDANHPLPIPHTLLTLQAAPSSWPYDKGSITVRFDWIGAGRLIDQPPGRWSGTPSALVAASATHFRAAPASPVLLEDRNGVGAIASAASAGDLNVQLSDLPNPVPSLALPIDLYYNLLKVTRGKTVANEILGSGDATRPNQSFTLSQSPVTWLQRGADAASTIALRVDGQPWTEVASFYGQPPDAQIFVTREDVEGRTHVDFGDGIEGGRLPSGVNNVVADYRVGAGASSPDAGKLTVIAQPFPGLRALRNPVPVGGGADAEPASRIRRYAPRSVLTFGRAVSVFDYEALAAQAPGVTRARASWSWSDVLQRAAVVVYVGDDVAAADSARATLRAAGDSNRPVRVEQAIQTKIELTLTLLVEAGWDEEMIAAQVTAALVDPEQGLFSADRMPIGQSLFDSQIEEAVLAVAGTVAIKASSLAIGGATRAGPLHNAGEGGFFTLDPLDLSLILQADSHGG